MFTVTMSYVGGAIGFIICVCFIPMFFAWVSTMIASVWFAVGVTILAFSVFVNAFIGLGVVILGGLGLILDIIFHTTN